MFRFSIDRGGTFTDVYAECPNGEVEVLKLLSEDPAYKDAPTEAIRRILQKVRSQSYRESGSCLHITASGGFHLNLLSVTIYRQNLPEATVRNPLRSSWGFVFSPLGTDHCRCGRRCCAIFPIFY